MENNDSEIVLEVEDPGHDYAAAGGRLRVLTGVDLELRAGEMVGVQGESGCGKTTLLLDCGAMQRPTNGHVLFAGDDIYAADPATRSRLRSGKIGYLFQTLQLVPYVNVLDNVRMVKGVTSDAARNWLARLGLEDRLQHKPGALSHGQRQRAALARALVHEPHMVIADEPTGNLDPKNARLVFETLQQFAEDGGAVLVATHDGLIDQFADRVLEFDSGRLVQTTKVSR